MAHSKKRKLQHLSSSLFPSLFIGLMAGTATGVVVTVYKFCAGKAGQLSQGLFALLRRAPWWVLPLLVLLFGLSLLFARIYRRMPELQGGGIPSSIGALRGLFTIPWMKTVVGAFFLSLTAFLFGVPLGTEGPSVQMGTALGKGILGFSRKNRPWQRLSMTGGACAGFAVATGAPLSGLLFSIEEAHRRISPPMVINGLTAVCSATLTTHLLSPLLGVEPALFHIKTLPTLSLKELWIPLIMGLFMGLFALLFLKGYGLFVRLFSKIGQTLSQGLLIFAVFAATVAIGILFPQGIFTGHSLIEELLLENPTVGILLLTLLLRFLLTTSANLSGLTGGIFLPLLAIGATTAALLQKLCSMGGLGNEFGAFFIPLGICGCIAGMMKMPFTAALFAVEVLGLGSNLLGVIMVAALAFLIPELSEEDSVGESVLERKKHRLQKYKEFVQEEFSLTVEEGAFAVGKQVRELFFPSGTYVLFVNQNAANSKLLEAGDVLRISLGSYNPEEAKKELSYLFQSPLVTDFEKSEEKTAEKA